MKKYKCEECGCQLAKKDVCTWLKEIPNFKDSIMCEGCADCLEFVDGPLDWLEQEAIAFDERSTNNN